MRSQRQFDTLCIMAHIEYAKELNQEQLDVVLHGDGHCLVLAGAGSGKTRTITYRVAYLIEQGIDPACILLLTFTNKASKEMLHRVSGLMSSDASRIWGGTFHSIGNRILRQYANIVGYTSSFSILDSEDAHALLKSIMKELHIDVKARRFPSTNVVHSMISFAVNTLTPLSSVIEEKHPHFIEFTGQLEEISRLYIEKKRLSNAMDFDDLLVNFLNVLQHLAIGERIAHQFSHVLVDEYQDTNALQALIVQAVGRMHKNVLVVGDDAQSIYAFRGADVRNILRFPNRFSDTRMFKLLVNYRSVPEILELANESLSHNTSQFEKELRAVKARGSKPMIIACASSAQEAQYIAEQILTMRTQNIALAHMAVLFRSSAHSQTLEFELLKRDIPYEYRGGKKFFERAHIKDVVSYVRVCVNVSDESAWLRVLNIQPGIGSGTAEKIIAGIRGSVDVQSVVDIDVVRLPKRALGGWKDFCKSVHTVIAQMPNAGYMIRAVLANGYSEYLEREYPDYKDRIEDVEQLANFAETAIDVISFLSDIALYDESISGKNKQASHETERIILSTIHQAKGLEWDTVFIMHLADQSFPSIRAMNELDGLEEERRLFYVAVTRARRKLFLTYPQMGGYDGFTFNSPSIFLEEVPSRLFERINIQEDGMKKKKDMQDEEREHWSWDADGPAIEVDTYGDFKKTPSVWKKSTSIKQMPKSFLSEY